MELFREVVPKARQHQNFQAITAPGMCEPEMRVIQGWAEGFPDRDGKFVKEFQTTFNACFWELYLNAVFRELGLRADFSHPAPDFVLSTSTSTFCAEATTANHPDGYAPEWKTDISPEALAKVDSRVLVEFASIRLANAISSKLRKYRESYSSLAHVKGRPFIICVAPFEQPFFYTQNDHALRRVLYGYDQPLWVPGPRGRLIVGEAQSERVLKESGSPVEFGFFAGPGMEEISAIIFSNTATFGKVRALGGEGDYPVIFQAFRYNRNGTDCRRIVAERPHYQETLLDGLHVCLNPFATLPLDVSVFAGREVAVHHYDPQTGAYFVDAPDGFLIQRMVMSLRPVAEIDPSKRGTQQPGTYREYKPKPWDEGKLNSVGGHVAMFEANHMAHYRGWTIVVAHDTVDNDWGAQAIEGLCRDLPTYTARNQAGGIRSFLPSEWYPTKEQALDEAKMKIDSLMGSS